MNRNKQTKKTILIDLDGVLNKYDGDFKDNYIPEIRSGAEQFLKSLSKKYEVKIFTSRPKLLVNIWAHSNNIHQHISGITDKKEPAYLHIDDRCIKFDGDYDSTIKKIKMFTPWYK